MNRFVLFLLLGMPLSLCSQSIIWVTECSDQTFCLNANSCEEGDVYLVEKAFTSCGNTNINYSYRIDIDNNGSQDIISSEDTISQSMPRGTHRIIWRATDFCGNASECQYLVTIQDCVPPSLICINGLTQNLDPPNCSEEFLASQFILTLDDNCTPVEDIEYGIRRMGDGMGFPMDTSIRFDSCDVGTAFIEVWVRDQDGLSNSCQGYVLLQDGTSECSCDIDAGIAFEGCAQAAGGSKLNQVRLNASVTDSLGLGNTDWFETQLVADSCYSILVEGMPFGGNYATEFSASRNEGHIVGFSTFDLLKISQHILGIESFTSFYQVMAADLNNSQTITTFDIVEGRKLLLGIYDTFPAVPSWRIIRPLADPSDLGQWDSIRYTYEHMFLDMQGDVVLPELDFVGVKMGDTNMSASLQSADDRETIPVLFREQNLEPGVSTQIELKLPRGQSLTSFQMALNIDTDQVGLEGVSGLPSDSYYWDSEKGILRFSWIEMDGSRLESLHLHLRASVPTVLSEAIELNTGELNAEGSIQSKNGIQPVELTLAPVAELAPGMKLLKGPIPNPASDVVRFEVWFDEPTQYTALVLDPNGRVLQAEKSQAEEGMNVIRLPLAETLPSGWYIYRLVSNGEALIAKGYKE